MSFKIFMHTHQNPHFINSHSSQNLNLCKLILENIHSSKCLVYDVNVDDLEQEIASLQKPVSTLWKRFCGYCKEGLVLMYVSKFGFAVWNPSTRQDRDLPVCPANNKFYVTVASGLAYDDSADDYKVFCIVKRQHKPNLQIQVWIYRLKSNIWRKAPWHFRFPLDYQFDAIGIGHFSNSSMHWSMMDAWKSEILTFDVRKESSFLVPQPDCLIKSVHGVLVELHVLEECLCISYSAPYRPHHAYLYMRKKDGVNRFTWTELYAVTTEPRICSFPYLKVLGYSKKKDKILLHFNRGGIAWYDLKKKHFAKVKIDMNPKWSFQILCFESLV